MAELNLVQTTVLLTAINAIDLGICPHCEQADGVERYMIDEDTPTSARYCSHCETRWRGKREPKAAA